jgi:hypothetical protein
MAATNKYKGHKCNPNNYQEVILFVDNYQRKQVSYLKIVCRNSQILARLECMHAWNSGTGTRHVCGSETSAKLNHLIQITILLNIEVQMRDEILKY